MISLCLPSRRRPELFKRMCLSALENAFDPNDIEFVVYRDNDDDSVYEYFGNHKEVRGKKIIHTQMFNECLKVATGPIYMIAVDDIVFFTKDWDKYAKDAFDQSADKIIFAFPNDKWRRSTYGQVGFLHKNWVDTVGYLLPPGFATGLGDVWINDIAMSLNRMVYLRQAVVIHLGPDLAGFNEAVRQKGHQFAITKDKHIEDETHIECHKRCQTEEFYYSREVERAKDVQLLQNFIDNFKTT